MSQFQENHGGREKLSSRRMTIVVISALLAFLAIPLFSDLRRAYDPLRSGIPPRSDGNGKTIHTLISKIFGRERIVHLVKWEIGIPSNISVCEYKGVTDKPNGCYRPTAFDGDDGQGLLINDFLMLKFEWPSLKLLSFSEHEATGALGHVDVVLKRQIYDAENWNLYFALDRDDYLLRSAVVDDRVEQYKPKPETSTDDTHHYPFAGDVDGRGIFLVRDAQNKRIANFGCDHDCFGITEVQNHMVKFRFDQKMIGDAAKIIEGIRQSIAEYTLSSESPDRMSGELARDEVVH